MKTNFILRTTIVSLATLALAVSVSAKTVIPKVSPTKTAPVKTIHVASSTKSSSTKSTTVKVNQASSTQARIVNMQQRGQDMVSQRIVSIGMLIGRIQNMSKLSDSDKTSILAPLRSEISVLINMRNTIASTTSTSTLKAQIDSITKSNRVYALIEPKANIIAASDRIIAITTSLNTIYSKLNSRLGSNGASSTDPVISSALSDFTAKISDALNQASSSVSEVSGLTPDNGDKAVVAKNSAALKDAKAKVSAAQKDLSDAQSDIKTVANTLLNKKS